MSDPTTEEFEQLIIDCREVIVDSIELSDLAPKPYLRYHLQREIYFYQMLEEALKAKVSDFTWTDKTAFLLKEISILGAGFHNDVINTYVRDHGEKS